jgi:GNAT superfamily N-acetyltransferase
MVLMMGEYQLKSGVTVTLRKFEKKDSCPCSVLLGLANPRPDLLPGASLLYERQMAAYRPCNIQKTAEMRDYRVVEVAGQVVGIVGIRRFRPSYGTVKEGERHKLPPEHIARHKPPAAEILDLVVADEFRRRKIGAILTLAVLIDKIEDGIRHFYAYAPGPTVPFLTYTGLTKASNELNSIRWGKVVPFYACFTKERLPGMFEVVEALLQPSDASLHLHS